MGSAEVRRKHLTFPPRFYFLCNAGFLYQLSAKLLNASTRRYVNEHIKIFKRGISYRVNYNTQIFRLISASELLNIQPISALAIA